MVYLLIVIKWQNMRFSPNSRIVIMHPCRHYWKSTKEKVALKANDVFFRSLKIIEGLLRTEGVKVLVFKYGPDVSDSKSLAKHLGIEGLLTWKPKSSRLELCEIYSKSNIVIGGLFNAWESYGVLYESLATGNVFLHKGSISDSPIIGVENAESLSQQLAVLINSESLLNNMQLESAKLYQNNIVKPFSKYLLDYVSNKSLN